MIVSDSNNPYCRQKLRSRAGRTAGDIVQAVVRVIRYNHSDKILIDLGSKAYSPAENCRQIITGVSERGPESVIKYWIQPRGSKRPGPKTAKERMMELLTTRVGQDKVFLNKLANLHAVEDDIGDRHTRPCLQHSLLVLGRPSCSSGCELVRRHFERVVVFNIALEEIWGAEPVH
jgi:hypothetical protein